MIRKFVGLLLACLVAVTALVGATPTPAQAATLKERLKSAWVPSMCQHPAGRLVSGSLPGVAPNTGGVFLDSKLSKTGKLIKKKPAGAVAVFHCSRGGIGWPDHIVFYDSNLQAIGHVDTGSVGENPGRQVVAKVSIKKRNAIVRVAAVPLHNDNELWGSSQATLTYRYSPGTKKMVKKKSLVYKEVPTAKKLMLLVKKGKKKAAQKYATKDTIALMSRMYRKPRKSDRNTVTLAGCYGTYEWDSLNSPVELMYRGCVYNFRRTRPGWVEPVTAGSILVQFRMSHKYWSRWYSDKAVVLAGGSP